MQELKDKINKTFDKLKSQFGWSNVMQAIKLQKAVLNVGVGRFRKDKAKIALINDRMAKITGQKLVARKVKKSIAAFKVREGDIVGYSTTLRGDRMYSFVDKLINVSIPRTKDFRGIKQTSVDDMGNLTIGIKEHTIFPEISDENLQDVFSLEIILVSSAKTKEEGLAFFQSIGIPFKK